MKKFYWLCILGCISFLFVSCAVPKLKVNEKGNISFSIDFNQLLNSSKGETNTITSVKISLSKAEQTTITTELTINNNVAFGKIENLVPGIWQIKAEVYSNTVLLFKGSAEVTVIAGKDSECKILFEPVIIPPATGNINITVGMNPAPGYKILNQKADKILFDDKNFKFYILDSQLKTIGVYNADTLEHTEDISLPQSPNAMCLKKDGTGFYLGYPTGRIYFFDLSSKKMTQVADILINISRIATFGENYLLALESSSYDNKIISLNTTTGRIISSKSEFHTLGELNYNSQTQAFYTNTPSTSPDDIFSIRIDPVNGSIISITESIYHGDYPLGTPFKFVENGTKLITAGGSFFAVSKETAKDMIYAGSSGYLYADLTCDDKNGLLYLLNRGSDYYYDNTVRKLLIIDQSTYFLKETIDLEGKPFKLFQTENKIIVFTEKNNFIFLKTFNKSN